MNKIDNLTPKQYALMYAVAQEWITRENAWRPVNMSAVEAALPLLYKGLDTPLIVTALSPRRANVIANWNGDVDSNMRENVYENVDNNVLDKVLDDVIGGADSRVRAIVSVNVRNNVDNNVNTLRFKVAENVRENADANTGANYYCPSCAADCGWSGRAAFADFFKRIGLELSADVDTWLQYRRESGVWYAIALRDRLIVSEAPYVLNRDDKGRLHCETGCAIGWRDGYGVYMWHGVEVPRRWIVERATLAAQDVLAEENPEVRRAGSEIIGWLGQRLGE